MRLGRYPQSAAAHQESRSVGLIGPKWPKFGKVGATLGTLLADDLAGRSDNKPELPISITKGQTEATFVLTDPALAEAVDDAAAHLGHELLNRQFEAPRDHRRVDLDGPFCRVDGSSHADMFLFSRQLVAYRYYIDKLLAG